MPSPEHEQNQQQPKIRRQVYSREEVADLDPFGVRKKAQEKEAEDLLSQAPPLSPEQTTSQEGMMELDPETIQQQQEVFNFLGFNIDLQQAYDQGEIFLPSQEQKEAAEQAGYILPLIIPGNQDRDEIIQKVKDAYSKEFSTPDKKSDGLWFSDQAKTDLPNTQTQTQPTRPN